MDPSTRLCVQNSWIDREERSGRTGSAEGMIRRFCYHCKVVIIEGTHIDLRSKSVADRLLHTIRSYDTWRELPLINSSHAYQLILFNFHSIDLLFYLSFDKFNLFTSYAYACHSFTSITYFQRLRKRTTLIYVF